MKTNIFNLPIGIVIILISLIGCYFWIGNIGLLAICMFCFAALGTNVLAGKVGGTNKGMAIISIFIPAFIYFIPDNTDYSLIGQKSLTNVVVLTILLIMMGWFSYNFVKYQFNSRQQAE